MSQALRSVRTVVDTATNAVIALIPVGDRPVGAAVTPDGTRVYVVNFGDGTDAVLSPSLATTTRAPSAVTWGGPPQGSVVFSGSRTSPVAGKG